MAEEVVLYEVSERIATVTLNRPEKRNALNSDVLRLLPQLLQGFVALITALATMLPTLVPLLINAVVSIVVAIANLLPTLLPLLASSLPLWLVKSPLTRLTSWRRWPSSTPPTRPARSRRRSARRRGGLHHPRAHGQPTHLRRGGDRIGSPGRGPQDDRAGHREPQGHVPHFLRTSCSRIPFAISVYTQIDSCGAGARSNRARTALC